MCGGAAIADDICRRIGRLSGHASSFLARGKKGVISPKGGYTANPIADAEHRRDSVPLTSEKLVIPRQTREYRGGSRTTPRARNVSAALRAYASMAASAAKGAVRRIQEEE
jgi:hypothetical protein